MVQILIRQDTTIVEDLSATLVRELSRRLQDDAMAICLNVDIGRRPDLVIVTPHAVHVVEVKDKVGNIHIDQDGRWWLDGEEIVNLYREQPETPVQQAENIANHVRTRLFKLFKSRKMTFNGRVHAYVLIPNPSPDTRSTLAAFRVSSWLKQHHRHVWITLGLDELVERIKIHDAYAAESTALTYTPAHLQALARDWKLQPTQRINAIPVASEPRVANKRLTPRFALAVAAFILISLGFGIWTSGIYLPRGCATVDRLNIRSAPGGGVVATVSKNTCFRIDGVSPDRTWARIARGRYAGTWVATSLLNGLQPQKLPVVNQR
ncbi:MAG: NERD domain-containing protein [Syntrophales bacterium]|uniref:NERD domain-containing protein n=1 Tax=Thermanaerothrix sp. TaxID=2972675 RepID=UPI002ADE2F86|nr:NERD domain-containing protein [Thermanaerothrix sp.]MCX7634546.1 NERD domain-containing protein [Syntrophales bacterium]